MLGKLRQRETKSLNHSLQGGTASPLGGIECPFPKNGPKHGTALGMQRMALTVASLREVLGHCVEHHSCPGQISVENFEVLSAVWVRPKISTLHNEPTTLQHSRKILAACMKYLELL